MPSNLGLAVSGKFKAVALLDFYTETILRHAKTDMSEAEDVGDDEVLHITAEGTCLVETADGQRYILTISEGQIQGPARVMQIEDISMETLRQEEAGRRMHLFLARANIVLSVVFSLIVLNLVRMSMTSEGIPAYVPAILIGLAVLAIVLGSVVTWSSLRPARKAQIRSAMIIYRQAIVTLFSAEKLRIYGKIRAVSRHLRVSPVSVPDPILMIFSRIRAIGSGISRRTAL